MVIDTFRWLLLPHDSRNTAVIPGGFLRGARLLSVAVLLLVGLQPDAFASHYRLAGSGLLTKAEIKAMNKAGVTSTKALLESGLDRKSRRTLAKKTKLASKRINSLVQQCDLLRIPGVGPTVVKLFQASGYKHIASLKKASPTAVWTKIKASNSRLRLVPEAPGKGLVANWVGIAKRLPKIVKGL